MLLLTWLPTAISHKLVNIFKTLQLNTQKGFAGVPWGAGGKGGSVPGVKRESFSAHITVFKGQKRNKNRFKLKASPRLSI